MKEIRLDRQEVMKAVISYMALKGYECNGEFTFHTNGGLTTEIKPRTYDFKNIVIYANSK